MFEDSFNLNYLDCLQKVKVWFNDRQHCSKTGYSPGAKSKSNQVLVSLFAQSIIVVMALHNLNEKLTVNLICHYLTDKTKTKMLCHSLFVSDHVMQYEICDFC